MRLFPTIAFAAGILLLGWTACALLLAGFYFAAIMPMVASILFTVVRIID